MRPKSDEISRGCASVIQDGHGHVRVDDHTRCDSQGSLAQALRCSLKIRLCFVLQTLTTFRKQAADQTASGIASGGLKRINNLEQDVSALHQATQGNGRSKGLFGEV